MISFYIQRVFINIRKFKKKLHLSVYDPYIFMYLIQIFPTSYPHKFCFPLKLRILCDPNVVQFVI